MEKKVIYESGNPDYDRSLEMLIDAEKNIVAFTSSRSDRPEELADGTICYGGYVTAYYPMELNFPYDVSELAKFIETCIGEWNKHPCYYKEDHGNVTFEAKYYKTRGFKQAVKGKKYISIVIDEMFGKSVELMMPLKSAYGYIGIETINLERDANWIDFAEAVIKFIEADIESFDNFKFYKKKINM